MTSATSYIITSDGTVLIRDLISGAIASGRTLAEAFAELRRLTSHAGLAAHTHEGAAA